jgi:hypothetical protein
MKKLLVIALASIYLLVSSGVVVNLHYCMGKLSSMGLIHHDSKTCGNCGMDNNGCCKDEVKVVKLQDNQDLAAGFLAIPKLEAIQPTYPAVVSQTVIERHAAAFANSHSPPPGKGNSVQSFYCIFRI